MIEVISSIDLQVDQFKGRLTGLVADQEEKTP